AGQRNAGRREAAPLWTRSKPVKVLVVDDHALVRRGLGHVIRECFSDAEVIEAGSATDALETLSTGSIDIALVDVRMPDADGLELLHDIKGRWPELPVIMLTSFAHAHYVRRALAQGGAGRLHAEGRHARGSRAGDQRGLVRGRQRALAQGDPEPVREHGGRRERG